jgi:TolB-like protein/Tfp pilus assembly protein PilF
MASVPVDPTIPQASIRSQLTAILKSGPFADSQRMARFLQFAVEETLNGKAQHLKENVIGIHVFDRAPAYDPRVDPIVRVEARRLRLKLREYYERYGQSDDLIFEFPKGQYSPVFRFRHAERARTCPANTIAVLPFTNLNADADADFLTEGLTEDLISALTRVSSLRVSAWTSAARMKGDSDNLDTIRDVLGVNFVLCGSIRKTHDRIRVLAHLIDTSTKEYVWSQTFDRGFKDIFAIQDEITGAIVFALRAKLIVPADTFVSGARSQNLESYELCLKGRFHSRERTSEGLQRSALCFEQAKQIDPTSASAYAGLADTFTLQAEYGFADGPSAMRKAKAAVEQALALNPASAEAHASHGLILASYEWSWAAAERAFLRSLELNPSYAAAHHWYSMNHLVALGRFSEAETELDAAHKLDPLSPVVTEGQAFLRFLRREYRDAIAKYSEIIKSDPSFYKAYASMGRACLHFGDHDRAIKMLEKALSLAGEVPTIFGALGQAYGMSGDRMAASHVLDKLRQIAAVRPVPSTCFGLVHLGLGEKEVALDWLELAVERRESPVAAFYVHPAYDHLRDASRFNALVNRVIPRAAILP